MGFRSVAVFFNNAWELGQSIWAPRKKWYTCHACSDYEGPCPGPHGKKCPVVKRWRAAEREADLASGKISAPGEGRRAERRGAKPRGVHQPTAGRSSCAVERRVRTREESWMCDITGSYNSGWVLCL